MRRERGSRLVSRLGGDRGGRSPARSARAGKWLERPGEIEAEGGHGGSSGNSGLFTQGTLFRQSALHPLQPSLFACGPTGFPMGKRVRKIGLGRDRLLPLWQV